MVQLLETLQLIMWGKHVLAIRPFNDRIQGSLYQITRLLLTSIGQLFSEGGAYFITRIFSVFLARASPELDEWDVIIIALALCCHTSSCQAYGVGHYLGPFLD